MPGLSDLMSYIDQKKRIAGRNLSDLVENPDAVGEQWSDQFRQDIPEMMNDPSRYAAGGVGSIASTATRMFNNKWIDAPQFKRIAGPNARYRSEAELAALEKDMFRKYLERENPLKYVRQNP